MDLPHRLFVVTFVIIASGFTGNNDNFDLVTIPAGTTKLGDPEGDDNEIVKTMLISTFRLMRNEVTNQQFERFVKASNYKTTIEISGSGYVWSRRWRLIKGADWRHPQGPQSTIDNLTNHPVVQVSALDAKAYCKFYSMRLPNQDEWEYAARGRQSYRYPWGNNMSKAILEKNTNAGTYKCCAASKSDGFARTAPVGSFPAGRSPFQLDDMAGNVWEWTSSPFPGIPGERVIRGGGWGNNPYCLRASYRHGNPPDIGLDMVGFRCAAD